MTVSLRDLGHRFPQGDWGIRHLNLDLHQDSFTLITGPNGSGKTLLIRHLLGLEQASEGSISFNGAPAATQIKEIRRQIALVFQEPEHQILGLTVAEDIEISLKGRALPAQARQAALQDCLELCGLAGQEHKLCTYLSGGEKRRLAMAAALAQGARVLILDEPFNDLDWAGAHQLISLLLRLRQQGTGIWLVTHDLEKCLAHCDRLVILDGGSIRADAHPDQLWDQLPGWGIRRPAGEAGLRSTMTWLMPGKDLP